jgi:hypothetical protein
LFQPLSVTAFPKFTKLPEDEHKNNSRCKGKVRHSQRTGNSAASSSNGIDSFMLLHLAVEAVIIIVIHTFAQQ